MALAAFLFRNLVGPAADHLVMAASAAIVLVLIAYAGCVVGEVRVTLRFQPAKHYMAAGE